MPFWFPILLLLYAATCLFLIMVILLQSGKEGGLSSLGSASQGLSDALGASSAERTLNRMTTYSAVGFMVLAILLSFIGARVIRTDEAVPEGPPAAIEAPAEPVPDAQGEPLPLPPAGAPIDEGTQ